MYQSTSFTLYRQLRSKYFKLLLRYNKHCKHQPTSRKRKRTLASKLKRLHNRIKRIELNAKMGFAAGSIAFALSCGQLSAQELGPFIQNDGANPFAPSIEFDNNQQPVAVDLDNDGDFDLVVGTENGYVYLVENVGTSTSPRFVKKSSANNPFNGIDEGDHASPAFADFDNDGDLDLILGTYYNRPFFFENYGTANSPSFNTFANSTSVIDAIFTSFPITGSYYTRPEIIDIDDDGDLDIFIGRNYYTNDYNGVALWQNDGSNNFVEQVAGANPLFNPIYNANAGGASTFFSRTYPSFVDIDDDGDLDVFIGDQRGYVRFFENTGNASSATFSNEITGAGNPFDGVDIGGNASPEFVDIDNDGDYDMIAGSSVYGELRFFENQGTAASPVFVELTGNNSPFTGFFSDYDLAPTAADIDGDSFLDVVLGVKYDQELRYFRNDQNGNFIEQTGSTNPFEPLAGNTGENPVPALVDIDNDGDLDLFITGQTNTGPTQSQMLFFRNDGGTFNSETSPVPTTQNYTEFGGTLADFDGDSDFDVLLGGASGINYTTSNFQFLENQGSPTTPNFVEIPVASPPINDFSISTSGYMKPHFADIDHDGDPDLINGISSGVYSGQLFFFENDGVNLNLQTGTASPFFDNNTGVNFDFGNDSQPALLDTDNDGDLDVLIGLANNEILFLENQNIPAEIGTTGSTSVTYTEGDLPIFIASGLTISDVTDDPIIQARVIIENYIPGEDLLDFDPNFGTSGTFETTGPNAGSLLINIPPNVTNSELAMVLGGVSYENIGASVTAGIRNIRFEVIDFDNTNPGSGDVVIITVEVISTTNIPPVVTTTAGDLTYTEGDGTQIIDDGITITDSDDTSLIGATISISSNLAASEDFIEFANQNGISGSYDNASGVLTLTGMSSIANYQTALQSVVYANISNNPSSLTRTISFSVNDGTDISNISTRNIIVIPINDAPSVVSENGQTPLSYTQNAVAIAIDPLIEVFDSDNTNLEGASVVINGFQSGDVLTFNDQNGITGVVNSETLTLSGTATLTEYRSALRSVTFQTSNGAGSRTVEFTANDGNDTSIPYPRIINITDAIGQPPVVETNPPSQRAGDIVTIDLCDIISDPDNTFEELVITVLSISSGAPTEIDGCDLRVDYSGLNFSGQDTILLRATDPDGNTDENSISITIEDVIPEPGGDVIIYNAVSPNNDGANDWWEIVNLTTPNNIELFNRWGDSVKTLTDYDAQTPNNQLDDLPSGTYFYKINSPQGDFDGFLVIKK